MIKILTITKNNWLFFWMVLNTLAPLFSFMGGYGFMYFFAFFYPLAQTFAISKIQSVKFPWLWMAQFLYWLLLLIMFHDLIYIVIGILVNSIFGQLLLRIMFGSFGSFHWLKWNTIALIFPILSSQILKHQHISSDILEILLIVGLFLCISFTSGIGLNKAYWN
jgi:hypothetical protein